MFKVINENDIDYEKDKNVDIHNLHQEFMRNPTLVGNYYKLRGQAEEEMDKAKRQVDVSKSNLDRAKAVLELNIRKTPEKYDSQITKLTENIVLSLMLIHLPQDEECAKYQKEYTEAQEKLIDAKRKFDIYYSATKAIEERRSSLENLVTLWSRNYFSVPNLPKPLIEDYQNTFQDDKDQKAIELRKEVNDLEEVPERRNRRG